MLTFITWLECCFFLISTLFVCAPVAYNSDTVRVTCNSLGKYNQWGGLSCTWKSQPCQIARKFPALTLHFACLSPHRSVSNSLQTGLGPWPHLSRSVVMHAAQGGFHKSFEIKLSIIPMQKVNLTWNLEIMAGRMERGFGSWGRNFSVPLSCVCGV